MKTLVATSFLLVVSWVWDSNSAVAAGNLIVTYEAGVLSVIGDDKSNGFSILEFGDGAFSVEAYDWYGEPTTINGAPRPFKAGKVKQIVVELDDGHDVMAIVGYESPWLTTLDDSLFVNTGGGADTLAIWDFDISGKAIIDMGASNENDVDNFSAFHLNVGSVLELRTGGGTDYIDFFTDNGPYSFNTALEGAYIDTGEGTKPGDFLTIDRLFTWTGILIITSAGSDQVNLESVLVYSDDLTIKTGEGEDSLEMTYESGWNMDWQLTEYSTSIVIDLGGSNDDLSVDGLAIRGNLSVSSGSGSDTIAIASSLIRETLNVETGRADDTVDVIDSSGKQAIMDGGKHYQGDVLNWIANQFADEQFMNWE